MPSVLQTSHPTWDDMLVGMGDMIDMIISTNDPKLAVPTYRLPLNVSNDLAPYWSGFPFIPFLFTCSKSPGSPVELSHISQPQIGLKVPTSKVSLCSCILHI